MGKFIAGVTDHLILPALVRLSEGEARLRERAGRVVPAPVSIRLLIDTGSKRSTLIPGIIRHLDPSAGGTARVATALRAGTTQLYWVRLEFPEAGLAPFELVQVARLTMPPELATFHGVLGRDLLYRFHSFHYDGKRKRYILRDKPGWLDWLWRWL